MSRQVAHLPPRCPFQKKPVSHDLISPSPCNTNESYPRHHKSSSQSSILDEHPTWLEDLLSDHDSQSKGTLHRLRRSASDSVTLLDGLADSFSGISIHNEEDSLVDNGSALESSCIYGPNSPRHKGNSTFAKNAIASALSEYVNQEPLQFSDSIGELNTEAKPAKRHAGQRSRVRKLQYIAELEKTVNVYENLETELSVRVASLLQERVALSLENNRLKQQVARIQHEKLIMEGQYRSLKKEAERLKSGLVNSPSGKVTKYFGLSSNAQVDTWEMLDMERLHLDSK